MGYMRDDLGLESGGNRGNRGVQWNLFRYMYILFMYPIAAKWKRNIPVVLLLHMYSSLGMVLVGWSSIEFSMIAFCDLLWDDHRLSTQNGNVHLLHHEILGFLILYGSCLSSLTFCCYSHPIQKDHVLAAFLSPLL